MADNKTMTGVTYYKLEDRYEGDVTKGCGLAGTEIDKNFHFLRGYDIKSIEFDEIEGVITLTRVNAGKLVLEGVKEYIEEIAGHDFEIDGTRYDAETGIFHLVINGKDHKIAGFFTYDDVMVNDSLQGNGSAEEPLRVSPIMTTGFYRTAKKYIEGYANLPKNNNDGDRYLVSDTVNPSGKLYNFTAVEVIDEILAENNDGWRVPTIDEWNDMLNVLELCDEDRNHDSLPMTGEKGKYAGSFLKEHNIWELPSSITKNVGFNALPAGVYQAGDYQLVNEGAEWWSISESEDDGTVYTERIHKRNHTVNHRAESKLDYYSLRLVNDKPISEGAKVIEGMLYNCVRIPGDTLTWTKENVSIPQERLQEIDPRAKAVASPLDVSGETKFFIAEWEIDHWLLKEFKNNDILILGEYSGQTDEEVILKDGELHLRWTDLYDKIKEYVDEKVATEKAEREAADEAEAQARQDADDAEAAARAAEDERLDREIEDINGEIELLKDKDEELQANIDAEAETRAAEDERLERMIEQSHADWEQALAEEAQARQDADEAEKTARETADRTLQANIDEEARKRALNDGMLSDRIDAETEARIANDIDRTQDYTMNANGGVTLKTNGGDNIPIAFDGNFGEINFSE